MRNPEGIAGAIRNAETVALCCHINPDGDTIGGALALRLALRNLGKKADVFCQDKVPDNLLFLPSYNKKSYLYNILTGKIKDVSADTGIYGGTSAKRVLDDKVFLFSDKNGSRYVYDAVNGSKGEKALFISDKDFLLKSSHY